MKLVTISTVLFLAFTAISVRAQSESTIEDRETLREDTSEDDKENAPSENGAEQVQDLEDTYEEENASSQLTYGSLIALGYLARQ